MLEAIERVTPNSEFRADILKEVREIAQRSSTIGDFFSRFLIYLFEESGLILIEPQNLRDLMTPIFSKLIKQPTKCTEILNEAGLKLRKLGYSPRIHKKPNICNFFISDDEGQRHQVTYNGNFQFADETFSMKEMLHLLDNAPVKFSANAATRPITQDLLFPTFAYIAGPNEIAYHAQLKGIYDFFSLEMPALFPRFGATIVEKKISKVLGKYKMKIHELYEPERLLKQLAKQKFDDPFDSFKAEVSMRMEELTRQAESIDKTLLAQCTLAKGKILKTIDTLEDKVASRLKKQNRVARQQITKAYNNLFPYGDLQERQINVLEYMMKFGKEFLQTVHQVFREANYGEHRVIRC